MENNKPITYDYKNVKVRREMEEMFVDAYRNLGWEITSQTLPAGTLNNVNIALKRDRNIAHKTALNATQNKIDTTLAEIEKINTQKRRAGLVPGSIVGTLGVLTFGGGMSMVMTLSGVGYLIGGIALGLAGIGIGLLGWLTAHLVKKHQVKKLEPILNTKFDQFSQLCETANQTLTAGESK